jgi:hypothetical protein
MSHSDPLFDPDNALEDDNMDNEDIYEMDGVECGHENGYEDDCSYDDHDDFYGESMDYDDYNDDMDGDHDSAMTSAGWGTDEDYGHYEDFHSDDGYGGE